jgi:hypothetical protein
LVSLLFVKIRRGDYAKRRGQGELEVLADHARFFGNNKGTKKQSKPPSRRDSALLPGSFVVYQNQADWSASRLE